MSRYIDADEFERTLMFSEEIYEALDEDALLVVIGKLSDAPTIDLETETFDKDINVRSKDEPYIDIETGILHWCGWKYRRIYETEPQTERKDDE